MMMAQDEVDYINFSVKGQDGGVLYYKVKSDKKFAMVFKNFCERKGLEYKAMHFLYDGQRVLGTQNPKRRNLENGAEILAVEHVSGGGVAAISFHYQDDIAG